MANDIWTTVPWTKEASDLRIDLASGTEITRLSGSALHTCNNYLPGGCSADGRRCLGVRLADALTSRTCAIMAHDLVSKHTALLEDSCANPSAPMKNPHSVVTAHLIDEDGQPTRKAVDEILEFFRHRQRA